MLLLQLLKQKKRKIVIVVVVIKREIEKERGREVGRGIIQERVINIEE